MGETANEIFREITEIQNGLIRLRAHLADLEIIDDPGGDRRPRTGWRFVRGSHSGNYIRDPQGTDRPPPEYGL